LGITNPYGQTKFMVERILMDLKRAEQVFKNFKFLGLQRVIFEFFLVK